MCLKCLSNSQEFTVLKGNSAKGGLGLWKQLYNVAPKEFVKFEKITKFKSLEKSLPQKDDTLVTESENSIK